jgi:hypothetical protein
MDGNASGTNIHENQLRRRRTRRRQASGSQAPAQRTGGRGKDASQAFARSLWEEGLTEEEVRAELKANGFTTSRISQLIKATRPPATERDPAPKTKAVKKASESSKYFESEAMSDSGEHDEDEQDGGEDAAEDHDMDPGKAGEQENEQADSDLDEFEEDPIVDESNAAAGDNSPSNEEPDEENEEEVESDPSDMEDDPCVEMDDDDMLSDPEGDTIYIDGCYNEWSSREARDEFDEFWGPYDDDSDYGPDIDRGYGSSETPTQSVPKPSKRCRIYGKCKPRGFYSRHKLRKKSTPQGYYVGAKQCFLPPKGFFLPGVKRKYNLLEAESVKKRPAAKRAQRPQRPAPLCDGQIDFTCIFSKTQCNQKARPHANEKYCMFCSEELMKKAAATARGRGNIVSCLKKFKVFGDEYPGIYAVAVSRVRRWVPEHAAELIKSSLKLLRKKAPTAEEKAAKAKVSAEERAKRWASCKEKRRYSLAPPSFEERKAYRAAVLDNQRFAKNKFYPGSDRRPRASGEALGEIPDNDCGLPAAKREVAKGLQAWCEQGSWGMCPTCGLLNPRDLFQPDMHRQSFSPEIRASACQGCSAKHNKMVPTPEDVPEALRNLAWEVVVALRPLDIDVGSERRANAGYRQKTRMITFLWAAQSVDGKIEALPDHSLRKQARKAFKYLKKSGEASYAHFYEEHKKFLRRRDGSATDRERTRPLHFIEQMGIETALWPHLYWRTDMCESHQRMNEVRLRNLRKKDDEAELSDSSSEDSDEEDKKKTREHSIKKSFQAKLLSPLLGYASDFELLQFVYDLHLWTDLGSKANLQKGVPMRILMKGHTMSPLYWDDVKHGLFDLVQQIGFPLLYWTFSPFEMSYPYHEYMLDGMAKELSARLHYPAMESMHLAHTMLQSVRGVLAGKTKHKGQGWTEHLFSVKNPCTDEDTTIHFFSRLEFQDGKRKKCTQKYHGSGRPHLHVLLWLATVEKLGLEKTISASMPEDPDLAAYVKGSQLDDDGESKWPIHEGESHYDADACELHIKHTQQDSDAGLRGYLPDIMDAMRCHQDMQVSDGRSLLLQYVTKYVAKFSDSSYDEWMSDNVKANSLARKVLFEYWPLEPEMVLQLVGSRFRQWDLSTAMGGKRTILPPRPNNDQQPKFVDHYMDEDGWRHNDMSLLEFLRKTGNTGKISGWLRQKYKHRYGKVAESEKPTLEKFANDYVMHGEQIVSAGYLWRMNDVYYGQWCMMHIPFRSLDTFQVQEVIDKVPQRYRWFATALVLTDDRRLAPADVAGYWRDAENVARDMELEGRTSDFITDTKAFVTSLVIATDKYLSGELDKSEEDAAVNAHLVKPVALDEGNLDFKGKQLEFYKMMEKRLKITFAVRNARNPEEEDEAREETRKRAHHPIVCLGPPGTGKTSVVRAGIQEVLRTGGSVLFALPTAQLAEKMRSKLPSHDALRVDTFTAAFRLHLPAEEGIYSMYGYDMVVIDEISQLVREDFERIIQTWEMADQVPTLVFLGDKYQLPGRGQRAWASTGWSKVSLKMHELHEVHRCKDEDFLKTLHTLRVSVPDVHLLNKILRNHKAWHGEEPDAADVGRLLREHPEATWVAATRVGVATINALALQALHPRKQPLTTLPGTYEDNRDNYIDSVLRTDRRPLPTQVPIYKGMKIYLTKNVRKDDHYINGMLCEVLSYDESHDVLWVWTRTNKRLPITIWSDPEHPGLSYYPIRSGYCSTVHKVQGDEFPFIIIYLDVPNMPAVAYTALSRVSRGNEYLIGGQEYLTAQHFVPVTL